MQFAPVLPIDIAQALKWHPCFGNYHLLLAHKVVEDPNRYINVYRDPERAPNFIIMDNSAAELGKPVDTSMLRDACHAIKPNVIALPDVLLNASETLEAVYEAYGKWKNNGALSLPEYMAIPQGNSIESYLWCAEHLAVYSGIAWWGIARNVRKVLEESRVTTTKLVHAIDRAKRIHLLGMSGDIADDVLACMANKDVVEGLDSSVPAYLGSQNHVISFSTPST